MERAIGTIPTAIALESAVAAAQALPAARGCRVCGGARVWTDEVEGPEGLWLAECARCRHRWTHPAPPAAPTPVGTGSPAPGCRRPVRVGGARSGSVSTAA